MIVLQDSVNIDVPPDVVWAWLEALPEHYVRWHADHVEARWVSGGAFVRGAVMEVAERLHGRLHRLRLTVRAVEPGRRVRYRVFMGLAGQFDVEGSGAGSRLTAAIEIGVATPVFCTLIDWLLRHMIPGRIDAIRQHQAEEGANLKALLEPAPLGLLGESKPSTI